MSHGMTAAGYINSRIQARRKTLVLPWPDKPLHANGGAHWSIKAKATKSARNAAWAVAREAPAVGKWPNATLLVEWWPPHRRFDTHNFPTCVKAYIDGIADAMGCDDKGFSVGYPAVIAGVKKPGQIVIHVMPPLAAQGDAVSIPFRGAIS